MKNLLLVYTMLIQTNKIVYIEFINGIVFQIIYIFCLVINSIFRNSFSSNDIFCSIEKKEILYDAQ